MVKRGRHARGKPPLIVRCVTGKSGFKQHEAQRRLDTYATSTRSGTRPVRIYECPMCGYWHLTSRQEFQP